MATRAAQNAWFAGAVGRAMNPDNAFGLQCKDVADDYCIALFGNWVNTVKPGNARYVFGNASDNYFIKVANNPNDPNQIPPHGAVIVWGPSRAVPEGHVAVVDSANSNNVVVIQQDGYLQYAARRVTLPYVLPNGAQLIGWLIPRLDPDPPKSNDDQIRQAYRDILEREADTNGILHYRNFTIDFVRADLMGSLEFKQLTDRKAAAAREAAEAKARAEAEAAEAARQAELAAAAAAAEAARIEAERLAAEAKAAEEAAKVPKPIPTIEDLNTVPPVTVPKPTPTTRKPSIVAVIIAAFFRAIGKIKKR